ncbi:ORF33 [black bullhead herpesvirus]|uniref:ORF33 n=1 Tax=black bullhead herpesvirus TaxID=508441 RepID=A0A2H5AJF1_9VIRU|nr:ORF33 [black bullhead herpesvirus]AUG72286.1 ORF33 [black bullhead herpesvirus]
MLPMMNVSITDYPAFVGWMLSTTKLTSPGFWDRMGGFFNLIAPQGRILDISRRTYITWNWRVHGAFSEMGSDASVIDRDELFRALTQRVWRETTEIEDIIRVIEELITTKGTERGDYWTRNLDYMLTNIRAENPTPIFQTLCHSRIIPELKNLVVIWKLHLCGVYAGRHDDLVMQVLYFTRRAIAVDGPVMHFIGDLKHSCALPISRKNIVDKRFVRRGFVTTVETDELPRDQLTKLIHKNGTDFEAVVDRIVWGATLWWYRRTHPGMGAYQEFWDKYCGWMDTATSELSDE